MIHRDNADGRGPELARWITAPNATSMGSRFRYNSTLPIAVDYLTGEVSFTADANTPVGSYRVDLEFYDENNQ